MKSLNIEICDPRFNTCFLDIECWQTKTCESYDRSSWGQWICRTKSRTTSWIVEVNNFKTYSISNKTPSLENFEYDFLFINRFFFVNSQIELSNWAWYHQRLARHGVVVESHLSRTFNSIWGSAFDWNIHSKSFSIVSRTICLILFVCLASSVVDRTAFKSFKTQRTIGSNIFWDIQCSLIVSLSSSHSQSLCFWTDDGGSLRCGWWSDTCCSCLWRIYNSYCCLSYRLGWKVLFRYRVFYCSSRNFFYCFSQQRISMCLRFFYDWMWCRDVTEYLQILLRKAGYNFHTTAEKEIVRQIKEKTCYVAFDPQKEEELLESEKSNKDTQLTYKLPDGNTIEVL